VIAGGAVRLALRASLLASLLGFLLAGVARAESVAVSVEPPPHLEKPIGVEVSGAVDGLHRLFAFVLPAAAACPWDSSYESWFVTELTWLTSAEGVALSPGAFSLDYSFSTADHGASVCAYLAESSRAEPDASGFAYVSWPIQAPYLGEDAEVLKRLAVEREEREQREAKESQEQQERERSQASELPKGGASPAAPGCTVPYLVGHTLSGARSLLIRAHCRVGKIHKPTHTRGRLLVVRQGQRRGAKLAANTAIAIYLRSPK